MEDIRQYIVDFTQRIRGIPFIQFVTRHWSLSLMYFSLILTALAAHGNFVSAISHLANWGILYGMRQHIRHSVDGTVPSCLVLVSLVITGIETDLESSIRLIVAFTGVLFIVPMWLAASLERPGVMKAKSVVVKPT